MRYALVFSVVLGLALPDTSQSQPDSSKSPVTLPICYRDHRQHEGEPYSHACRALRTYTVKTASVFAEEDFFQKFGSTSDRNYTMGLGFSRSGVDVMTQNHDLFLRRAETTVDWLSNWIARPISFNHLSTDPIAKLNLDDIGETRAYSEMLSGTAFTPKDLRATAPVVGDRPYAFLLGWTVTRTTASTNADDAWASDLTLGTIGSRLGRNVQRFIHATSRGLNTHFVPGVGAVTDTTPPDPKGWGNQIMDVPSIWLGIPTARYGLTYTRRLWAGGTNGFNGAANPGPYIADLTSDVNGELGYYTDGYVGLRARLGFFSIPFWAWREDPLTSGSRTIGGSPKCVYIRIACFDGFAFAGGKLRAIGYNALLQGYPGYTGYHIGWSEREYWGTEVSSGVAVTLWWNRVESRGMQFVYELYANRSPEYDTNYKRSHTWGGIYVTPIW